MSLAEDNLRLATLKAIIDAANDEMGKVRAAHTTELVKRYDEEGTSSFKVKLPDGTVVAAINLKVPKKTTVVTNEEAFLAWVEATHPNAIQATTVPAVPEEIIPARPEQVLKSVSGKALAELEKQFEMTEDGVVDTATGTVVDGMVVMPAPAPKSFEVRYETGTGREDLANAYRAGRLNHVVAGGALPPVIVAPPVERRLEAVSMDYDGSHGRLNGAGEPLTVVGEILAAVEDGLTEDDYNKQQCSGCGDWGYTLSSRGLCDGCEAEPAPVSPARAALNEHADELAAKYGSAPADDFDPGDFGTPVTGTGGW